MCKFIDRITGNNKSSAKVVNGTLVLSLPDAQSPVVWRWDLGEVKASAIEVQEEDSGAFKLILKTPDGDMQDVAPFSTRQKALNALLAVSDALENAQGQIKAAANDGTTAIPLSVPHQKHNDGMKVLTGLFAIVIIIGLFVWLGNMAPKRLDENVSTGTLTATPSNNTSEDSGVAISADDYLNGL